MSIKSDKWIRRMAEEHGMTLEGVGVLLRYAPDAGMARRFPERPGA